MILIVYPTVPNVQLRRGGCGDSDIYTGVDSEAAITTGSFIRRSVLAFGTPRVAASAYIAVAVTDGRRVSCPSLALPFLGRRAVTVAGRGPGARAVAPNVAPSVGIGPGSVAHTPGPGLQGRLGLIVSGRPPHWHWQAVRLLVVTT
jgi:hypothetical protein